MKKTKFLMALACFGLLITGCNPATTSSESKPTSTSGNPASTTSKPSTSSTPSSTSSVAPDPETYYSAPYEAGYESAKKWEKGHEYKFTFSVPKNYTKVVFAFGAQMSSSSHGSRSLYTDHNGASSDDSFESNEANDGTCRIVVKVNGVEQEVTHDTYEEAGLTNSEINYFKVSEFAVNAGDVVVSMTTHAKAGYRLMLGEEARLYYKAADESATPVVPVDEGEGYNITFSATHGEVWVYESGQDYTQNPVKTNTTQSRDEDGKKTKWIEPEETDTKEPQVNFKVVCEAGYEIDADCFAITGEFNKIKVVSNDTEDNSWIVRITKIKSDLAIVVTPKVHQEGINGYEITFALTNATAKVYVGPKDETGSNVDAGAEGKYYTRAKTDPFDYSKASDCQFNFEIIPNEGYEFNDGVEWGEATEISSSAVSFIAPGANYNKLKKSANGGYTLTKVAGALTITAAATEKQQVQARVIDFSAKTANHSAYNDTWAYGDATVAGGANNGGQWAFVKMGGKQATITAEGHPGTWIKTDTATEYAVASVTIKYVGKCYNQDSEKATVKVESYSDAALATKVAETPAQEVAAITTNEGVNEVTYEFAAAQAANLYYKVCFDIVNTTTYNGVVALEKITFNVAA